MADIENAMPSIVTRSKGGWSRVAEIGSRRTVPTSASSGTWVEGRRGTWLRIAMSASAGEIMYASMTPRRRRQKRRLAMPPWGEAAPAAGGEGIHSQQERD